MKALAVSLLLCLAAGCTGFNLDGSGVTDELRDLCYWLPDSEIRAMLNDIQDAQDAGTPEIDLEREAVDECDKTSVVNDCNACFTLAIDTIYH